MKPSLLFLGTGAGCGVPSFYCDCKACREAKADPLFQRTCCGLVIQGHQNTLIDTPPDLRCQLVREKIDHIDHLLLTHEHYDHTGGMGELEFLVRLKTKQPLPAYMSQETAKWISKAYEFMEDCLDIHPLDTFDRIEMDGLTYTALPAQHAPGTFGFLIQSNSGKKVGYFPDTGPLSIALECYLKDIDILIIDATFWGSNWTPEVHQSVESAVQTGLHLGARQVYLTHLSMHYDQPITCLELEAYLHTHGDQFHLAYDGLRLDI